LFQSSTSAEGVLLEGSISAPARVSNCQQLSAIVSNCQQLSATVSNFHQLSVESVLDGSRLFEVFTSAARGQHLRACARQQLSSIVINCHQSSATFRNCHQLSVESVLEGSRVFEVSTSAARGQHLRTCARHHLSATVINCHQLSSSVSRECSRVF